MLASLLLASAGHGEGFTLHYQIIVASTVLVVGLLILLASFAHGQIGLVPRGLGAAFEHVFDWLDGLAHDMMGPEGRQYVPFLMSIFLFVLLSNWGGLIPWPAVLYSPEGPQQAAPAPHTQLHGEPHQQDHGAGHHAEPTKVTFESPSASYNTTLALALISFFAFNYYGLKKKLFPPKPSHDESHHDHPHHHHQPGGFAGFIEWLLHFTGPTRQLWASLDGTMRNILVPMLCVLFIGLMIIEEVARILSLSIRLFGNISGEHQVKTNLLLTLQTFLANMGNALAAGSPGFLGWGALAGLIWGASLFATCLGALAGFIQAMIFAVLSMVYIAHAVADEH